MSHLHTPLCGTKKEPWDPEPWPSDSSSCFLRFTIFPKARAGHRPGTSGCRSAPSLAQVG